LLPRFSKVSRADPSSAIVCERGAAERSDLAIGVPPMGVRHTKRTVSLSLAKYLELDPSLFCAPYFDIELYAVFLAEKL
jgi:hypothetical protein